MKSFKIRAYLVWTLFFGFFLLSGCGGGGGNGSSGSGPVELGTAANYAILAQTGVASVPTSVVTGGDVGLSPAARGFLT